METFDAPDACDAYRRTRSIVPQQALAMVNSNLIQEQSSVLATSLWESAKSKAGDQSHRLEIFVRLLFETCLSRLPTEAERRMITTYFSPESAGKTEADQALARAGLVRVILNHDDFLSIR